MKKHLSFENQTEVNEFVFGKLSEIYRLVFDIRCAVDASTSVITALGDEFAHTSVITSDRWREILEATAQDWEIDASEETDQEQKEAHRKRAEYVRAIAVDQLNQPNIKGSHRPRSHLRVVRADEETE